MSKGLRSIDLFIVEVMDLLDENAASQGMKDVSNVTYSRMPKFFQTHRNAHTYLTPAEAAEMMLAGSHL